MVKILSLLSWFFSAVLAAVGFGAMIACASLFWGTGDPFGIRGSDTNKILVVGVCALVVAVILAIAGTAIKKLDDIARNSFRK